MFNTLIVLLGGCLLLSPILFFLGSSRAELEQLPSNASFASYGKTLLKGLFPFLLVVFSPLGDFPPFVQYFGHAVVRFQYSSLPASGPT